MTDAKQELVRVTFNLTPRSAAALTLIMNQGEGKTDAINRAVQVYGYLLHCVNQGGSVYARGAPEAELERLNLLLG